MESVDQQTYIRTAPGILRRIIGDEKFDPRIQLNAGQAARTYQANCPEVIGIIGEVKRFANLLGGVLNG